LKELLPKLLIEYHRLAEEKKEPAESVIRAVSDRQRRLNYDLAQDPKSGIDQRQLLGLVLFGVTPGVDLMEAQPLIGLTINCRCGLLHLKSEIVQDVDVAVRHFRFET
jgi:hypothetical protein